MPSPSPSSRREFLHRSARGACVIGGAAGFARIAPAGETPPRPLKVLRTFHLDARRPRGIAVRADGTIFVAADEGIVSFDSRGRDRQVLSLKRPARCVAVQPKGHLFVGLARSIEIFDRQLHVRDEWHLDDAALVTGISVSGKTVCVADSGNGVVWRFDSLGNRLAPIRRTAGGFAAAQEFFAVAASSTGTLHVANPLRHRVESYDSDGALLRQWGGRTRDLSGFNGCCNPVSLLALNDGRIITGERGQSRIKLFSAAGTFESLIAGPEDFGAVTDLALTSERDDCSGGGIDLTAGPEETLYGLDRSTGTVLVIG